MARRPGRAAAVLACLTALLGGCSSPPPVSAPPETARPWPDRPVVELRFDVAPDLRSVTGRERIEFTPDQDTCELVFRAWPNKPGTSRAGNALTVSEVRVDGRAAAVRDVAAGAPEGAPATLLEVPLDDCLAAGETRTVDLAFDLVLGVDANERVGTSSTADVAWFATAFPLLAWERESGWARSPAVALKGEMASSEDFRLASLEVSAPAGYEVLGTGQAEGTAPGPNGSTVHRFTAPAVRDVAVAVGELRLAERTIDGVRVHLGLDAAVEQADGEEWLDAIAASMTDLVDLLGPFPYEDLWISVLSSQTSGIEFPGAIQFGDVEVGERRPLVTHELAHMWFYGWVGNDQGEDPWLDESFATFAGSVADGRTLPFARGDDGDSPPVGEPMTYWADATPPEDTYVDTVYTLGGAALVEARERAGPAAFDAALRGYLNANAYSVATPDDVRAAFEDLPEVIDLLREVGALP
jgi:aminopeptidase N